MQIANDSFGLLAAASNQFARRRLTIGENRLELLTVDVQEGRERLLHALLSVLVQTNANMRCRAGLVKFGVE